MKIPEISAIMTVYNGQAYLSLAIESLLNQTFSNFELIIVNDHSTDESWKVIEKYCSQDDRVISINNPSNFGPFKSANQGLRIAKGTYIARMDSDDLSHPLRFERQLDFLKSHPEVGLLGSNGYYIDDKGKKQKPFKRYENDLNIRWGLLFNSQFLHSTIIFKRSLLDIVGGYSETPLYSQDYDMYIRLLDHTTGSNLRDRLVYWRRTNGSISSKFKQAQLSFGIQIALDNINRLFGYTFINDPNEFLIFRRFYRGSFTIANTDHVNRYFEIIDKFSNTKALSPSEKSKLFKEIGSRLFESIYRKGFNKDNLDHLSKVFGLSPLAIPIGIKNLFLRASNKVFGPKTQTTQEIQSP